MAGQAGETHRPAQAATLMVSDSDSPLMGRDRMVRVLLYRTARRRLCRLCGETATSARRGRRVPRFSARRRQRRSDLQSSGAK